MQSTSAVTPPPANAASCTSRGFSTRREAQEALTERLAEINRGELVRPTRSTLGEYLTLWLEGRRADLRPTTWYGYRKVVEARIMPDIGNAKLSALDTASLEAWYGRLIADGLSAKTVANTAGVLSVALGDAVRLGKLRHNPASSARLPRRERREMAAWTEDEASTFLAAVVDERLYPLWRLVLATGLRRGELCGLRWRDRRPVRGHGRGRSSTVSSPTSPSSPEQPKTRAGARVVALDADTVTALAGVAATTGRRAARRRAGMERSRPGVRRRARRAAASRDGHPVVARGGRSGRRSAAIRLHDARHTAATLVLRAGVPGEGRDAAPRPCRRGGDDAGLPTRHRAGRPGRGRRARAGARRTIRDQSVTTAPHSTPCDLGDRGGAGGNRTPVHQPVDEPATTVPGFGAVAAPPAGRLVAWRSPNAWSFPGVSRLSGRQWSFPPSSSASVAGLRRTGPVWHFCSR